MEIEINVPSRKWHVLRLRLMQVAFMLSILSQMPLFRLVIGIPTQFLIYPGWILLLAVSLFQGIRMKQSFLLTTVLPSIIFILFLIFYEILSGNRYFSSGLSFQFYMAIALTWVGYVNADVLFGDFSELTRTFLWGTFLLAIDIYWEFFRGYSLETIDYVFRSKNSAAFILLMGILLAIVEWRKQSLFSKVLRLGLLLFFCYLCVVMRSRAVLLGMFLLLTYWLYSSSLSKGMKFLITLFLLGAILLIYFDPSLNELVIDNVLLNGKDASNWNEVSSNRLEYFSVLQEEWDNLLFGIGESYMDNFYLESILNNGVFLGGYMIILAILPLRMFYHLRKRNDMERFLAILVVIHLVNAFFEGYTPFGPGTKCLLLWLFYGAWISWREWGASH